MRLCLDPEETNGFAMEVRRESIVFHSLDGHKAQTILPGPLCEIEKGHLQLILEFFDDPVNRADYLQWPAKRKIAKNGELAGSHPPGEVTVPKALVAAERPALEENAGSASAIAARPAREVSRKPNMVACPGCGTELFEAAPCCLVCGAQFKQTALPSRQGVVETGDTRLRRWAAMAGLGSVIDDTPLWCWAVAIAIIGGAIGFFLSGGRASRTLAERPAQISTAPFMVDATRNVDAVRNGIIEDHDGATVGKAFESAFQNAKWSSLQTPAGQTVVQFDGTANANTLIASGFQPVMMDGRGDPHVVPVQFQFTLSADGRSVYLEHFGPTPFQYVDGRGTSAFSAERTLDFVYQRSGSALSQRPQPASPADHRTVPSRPADTTTVAGPGDSSHPVAPVRTFNTASLARRPQPVGNPADLPEAPAVVGSGGSASASLPGMVAGQAGAPPPPRPVSSRTAELPIGGQLIPAKVVSRVEPEYPRLARQAGANGVVELEATVSADGKVKNARVVRGNVMLQRAAIDAILQWHYQPAMLNGKPVDSPVVIKLNFVSH